MCVYKVNLSVKAKAHKDQVTKNGYDNYRLELSRNNLSEDPRNTQSL